MVLGVTKWPSMRIYDTSNDDFFRFIMKPAAHSRSKQSLVSSHTRSGHVPCTTMSSRYTITQQSPLSIMASTVF